MSNCFVQDPVVANSSIVVSGSNNVRPPPSHHLRFHVIFTALVAHMHFWFWHITTIVLVLPSASEALWSTCPSIGLGSRSDRVEQHQDAVSESVVQLSVCHPMGSLSVALVSFTCPAPVSIPRKTRFDTTSSSSSYHQPT